MLARRMISSAMIDVRLVLLLNLEIQSEAMAIVANTKSGIGPDAENGPPRMQSAHTAKATKIVTAQRRMSLADMPG